MSHAWQKREQMEPIHKAGFALILDVLINNAAMIAEGDQDVLTIRPEVVARTVQTNALGALRVSQAFVPRLLDSDAGRIVNVSSGACS